MKYKNYLIFDFGASNGRVIVGKYNGEKLELETTYRFDNRPVFVSDTLYWDILRLYSELKTGIQASINIFKEIASLGIDAWGVDFGFIDKKGKLISNPIHYRDEKRNFLSKDFFNIISRDDLFNLTGAPPISVMSLFNIYSLKLNGSLEFLEAYKFLMIPDLFNYFLTGQIYNEFSNITTTLLYNQKQKKLESRILKTLGLSKGLFGKIINPGTNIGYTTDILCRELSIKKISVSIPATHDTASAVAGIPVVTKNTSWAFISIGTWCIVGMQTAKPLITKKVLEMGFANEGSAEGTNLLLKDMTGLWIIQKCRDKWIKDKGSEISWEEIIKISNSSRPFTSFIDVDDSRFSESTPNMPQRITDYIKINNQTGINSISEITRCFYESLVMKFRYNLSCLERIIEKKIELLYLVGGGINNKLLCQWIADATGLHVLTGPVESTALGNFLMQLKGNSEINNLDEGRQISLNSLTIDSFEPKNKDFWDEGFYKYINFFKS